jgi:hypothetical protein
MNARTIPYAFRDGAGQPYRLDDGSIGRAVQQGAINQPGAESDGRVRALSINGTYWEQQEAIGRLKILRKQNCELDSLARDIFDEFDPTAISDKSIRRAVSAAREARLGQPDFRRRLIQAYEGRCAVTGCCTQQALEAAHIIPHSLVGDRGMDPRNGLLLRADVHSLFDGGLIDFRMEGEQLRMSITPTLKGSEYEELARQPVRMPENPTLRPSPRCIERRWEALRAEATPQ